MKKIKIYLVFAFISLMGTTVLFAGNEDRAGSAGATQLLINPWTRSIGFAGMNTAIVRGIQASFLNPAGLAFTRKTEVVFSNTNWLKGADIQINSIGISQKLGESSVLGLSVMSMDFGDLRRATEDIPDGDGTTFSPNNLNIGISYGKEFSNSIYGGVTVRIISEAIANATASGLAFDAGIQYITGDKDQIKFGIALKNVGPPMSFDGDGFSILGNVGSSDVTLEQRSDEFEMPSLVNIGVGYDFDLAEDHKLTGMANFTSNSFTKDQYGAGLEYSFKNYLVLRGGYMYEDGITNDLDRTNVMTGPAAGASVQVPIGSNGGTLGFDYGFRATDPFDGIHSIGVRVDL